MTNYEFRQRIAKYNTYENHPLKDDYLKEKQDAINEISKEKSVKRISIIRLIMIIMIFVYLISFINSAVDGGYIETVLGILNIIGIVVLSFVKKSIIQEHNSYKAVIEKYKALGVEEFSQSDVEKGSCYDNYGCCCVTNRQLSIEEREICNEAHFRKCKTFMRSAYGYTEEDFENMEMIHN